MLSERIGAFIRGESDESFGELALAVFRWQYERSAGLRALGGTNASNPADISDWRRLPAAPISALDDLEAAERQPDPDLQRAVTDHSFAAACLRGMGRPPVLSLIPTGEDPADPDLALMADRLLQAWAAPDSVAMARQGVEVAKARSFLGARQRDRRPTVLLGTSASLARLVEALDRRGLRFRLPPGSQVIEIGGPDAGRPGPGDPESATPRAADPRAGNPRLPVRLADGLAVAADAVTRGHRLRGLITSFYAGHDRRGEPQPFRPPPWVRARVLDPVTLVEAPAGAEGTLAVFDLASLGSPPYLLTEVRATAVEEGFRLVEASS